METLHVRSAVPNHYPTLVFRVVVGQYIIGILSMAIYQRPKAALAPKGLTVA